MTRPLDADVWEAIRLLYEIAEHDGYRMVMEATKTVHTALQQAEARAVAAEADARRYRWLRLADTTGPRTMQMQYRHVEHLDAAIDAAQEAKPGGGDG